MPVVAAVYFLRAVSFQRVLISFLCLFSANMESVLVNTHSFSNYTVCFPVNAELSLVLLHVKAEKSHNYPLSAVV
jgi:hypothetical protein